MSVTVTGPKRGEMQFSAEGLDKVSRRAIEANIRQRGYTVREGYTQIFVKVNIGTLKGAKIVIQLEEIHASIKQTIDHKVAQLKLTTSVT